MPRAEVSEAKEGSARGLPLPHPPGPAVVALSGAGVLFLGLLLTWLAWRGTEADEALKVQTSFEYRVRDADARISQRMVADEQVLRGVAALFAASERVERAGFRDYVAALHLEEQYPGFQGVGFAVVVPPADLERHTREIQESIPGYAVHPPGPREFYTSVVFLEPLTDRNLRAIGYDMHSEPVRQVAMDQARDEARAVLSGKVRLVQETDPAAQAGVLMYLPVYRHGAPPQSVAERRERLLGWVYLPFRMGDLMEGTLGERGHELDVRIYDGEAPTTDGLLFHSAEVAGPHPEALFEAKHRMSVAGRPWTLLLRPRPTFHAQLASQTSSLVALGGICLSLLTAALVSVLVGGRDRAVRAARDMNRDLLKAHAALQVSELRFRTMADGAPVLIWTVGLDGLATWFNRPWLEFTDRTMAQELGLGWVDSVHPDDRQRCQDVSLGAFKRRESYTLELRLRRHDGAWRWLVNSGTPLHDEAGTFTGYIGSCIDITGRREAEALLQESEMRLRLALRGGDLGLWDWDIPSGRVIFNERWAQMLGFSLPEIEPNVSSWERLVHPEDLPRVTAVLQAHLRGESASFAIEHRLRHKDGHWVWVLDSGVVVDRAADGTPLRAAGTHLDVSERKRAEEERKQLLARSARAERAAALGTLAAGMAHEINNPLAIVVSSVGFAQSQLERFPRPGQEKALADVQEALRDAVEGALRVRDLLADLRSFASGQHTADAQCDLAGALDRAARVAHHAQGEGTTLTVELPPLPPVVGSEAELVELFGCLLVNAGQATGAHANAIRITAEVRGPVVAVQLTDTGTGIAPEVLPRIFDPFFTTRGPGRGKGLGLPVALGIAQGLGGSIEVQSIAGKGTTVTVTLPVSPG